MRIIGLHTFLLIKEKKMVSNQYIAPFDRFKTYSIGFDRMQNTLLEKNHQAAVGYPPYNIQQTEDFKYEIEMALAGFDKKDIEIEVAEGVLTVKSIKDKDKGTTDEHTLYKGISQRNFTKKFTLADDIVVDSAELKNGMLTISLERIVPEEKKPQLIQIN